MDNRRKSQERRRSTALQDQELTSDPSVSNESSSNLKENRSKSIGTRKKRTCYNDSDSEENIDQVPVEKHVRGDSTDPEGSDENPTDCTDNKSPAEKSPRVLSERSRRRKSAGREEKSVSKAGEGHEEDIDEDRDPLSHGRKTESSASAGSRRQRRKKSHGKGKI